MKLLDILNLTDPTECTIVPSIGGRPTRPTDIELGVAVTVGVVAISSTGDIVAVSDQRVSHSDQHFPSEEGAIKTRPITADNKIWVTFAADDMQYVPIILRELRLSLAATKDRSVKSIREASANSYATAREKILISRSLSAIGYSSIKEFMKESRHDLGDKMYDRMFMEVSRFNPNVHLIVFGSSDSGPFMFQLENPGWCSEYSWQGYSAVGSGQNLALGALRQKPISFDTDKLVFHILDAKFSAEYASYVGKSTYAVIAKHDGSTVVLRDDDIARLREISDTLRSMPPPQNAIDIIARTINATAS